MTPRNAQYLDFLIGIVTDRNWPGFPMLWEEFGRRVGAFGKTASPEAVGRLREFHELVKEYRRVR